MYSRAEWNYMRGAMKCKQHKLCNLHFRHVPTFVSLSTQLSFEMVLLTTMKMIIMMFTKAKLLFTRKFSSHFAHFKHHGATSVLIFVDGLIYCYWISPQLWHPLTIASLFPSQVILILTDSTWWCVIILLN